MLFFSFFLSITTSSFGQNQHYDSLTTIVNEIDSSNVYEMSYTVGFAGTISKQYSRFKKLLQWASNNELSELAIHHRNAVVRLYALQALRRNKVSIAEDIIEQFKNDPAQVTTLYGCQGGIGTVSFLSQQNLTFLTGEIKKIEWKH